MDRPPVLGKRHRNGGARDFLDIFKERPLEAWVAPGNVASMRVLEKTGFAFDRDEEEYRVFRLG